MRAIDMQLTQVWHATGAALALNRTLVLPQLLCFCARNWWVQGTGGCVCWERGCKE